MKYLYMLFVTIVIFACGVAIGRGAQHGGSFAQQSQDEPDKKWPVTRVEKGDVLRMIYMPPQPVEERVHLMGIQCPGKDQRGYEEATKFVSDLLEGRKISIKFDNTTYFRDQYGRMEVYVFDGDRFINLEMIDKGLCRMPDDYRGDYFTILKNAERFAIGHETGIWKYGMEFVPK